MNLTDRLEAARADALRLVDCPAPGRGSQFGNRADQPGAGAHRRPDPTEGARGDDPPGTGRLSAQRCHPQRGAAARARPDRAQQGGRGGAGAAVRGAAPTARPRRRRRGARPRPAAEPDRRPDGHRDHGQWPRPGLCRAERQAHPLAGEVSIRAAAAWRDRAHRLPDRPTDRRVLPDGGRAAARRIAGQRRHRADRLQRLDPDHPEVLDQAARRRRPGRFRHRDPGDGRSAAGLRRGQAEPHRLRRHRHRQDDPVERARPPSSPRASAS